MKWTPWCSAVIIISLTGCMGMTTGQKFDDRSVKHIRNDKTTRAEIVQMFGQPPSRSSIGGGKETWVYHYSEAKGHATAITYVPIVGLFAGGGKGTSNLQTLTIQFTGDVVSACTYGKTSYSGTTSAMGLSSATDQQNSVMTPCDEAQ